MTSSHADLKEEILQLSHQIDALSFSGKKKEGKTDGEVSVVIMTNKSAFSAKDVTHGNMVASAKKKRHNLQQSAAEWLFRTVAMEKKERGRMWQPCQK